LNAETLLGWIPRGSELVLVARGPFEQPSQKNPYPPTFPGMLQELSTPQLDGTARLGLSDSSVSVLAVTHFEDQGAFTGCLLMLLAPDNDQTKALISHQCTPETGYRVPVWMSTDPHSLCSEYFCFPSPGVFVTAYDARSLRETLDRMGRSDSVGLPGAMEKLRTRVNTGARCWAIRAENRQINDEDPERPESSVTTPNARPSAICLDWQNPDAVRIQLINYTRRPRFFEKKAGLRFVHKAGLYVSELRAPHTPAEVWRVYLTYKYLLGLRIYL
jgi:hypothetical protein